MKTAMQSLMSEAFEKEMRGLAACRAALEEDGADALVRMLAMCQGKLFFSGVGKNKFVAEKIVHTMQSLGIAAFFLDPLGSLHGDLGVLCREDALCFLSKSGNTAELIALNRAAKKIGAATAAITCGRASVLARECGQAHILPDVPEADADGLVPTTSTTMFLCFGDALALGILAGRNEGHVFLENHPGGELGKQAQERAQVERRRGIKLLVMDVDGTLTDGRIYYGIENTRGVSYHVKDGYGIKQILPQYGITPVIITGRKNPTIAERAGGLGVEHIYQGVSDKVGVLRQVAEELQAAPEEIAYIGDDGNDLACMALCGLTGCPADAAAEVAVQCDFVSQFVGGCGAVRDFIEWICRAKDV